MNQLLNKRAAVALSLVSAFIASLLPVAVFGQTSGVVNWAQASSSGSTPPARDFAAMDYDSAHAVTVLFGGSAQGSGDFRDTWTWTAPAGRKCFRKRPHPLWSEALWLTTAVAESRSYLADR